MFRPHKRDQYALRAIFELAKRKGTGPTKISKIASAQRIPVRFLEVILSQLKGSGLVASKRGFYGGYALVRDPEEITVGDIFRFMRGEKNNVLCVAGDSDAHCPFYGNCALAPLWNRVQAAVYDIYDNTTIKDLMNNENGGADLSAAEALVNGATIDKPNI